MRPWPLGDEHCQYFRKTAISSASLINVVKEIDDTSSVIKF